MTGGEAGIDEAWWQTGARDALPVGAPFRPGLDPLPRRQHAWAVIKDRSGRPAHGDPAVALREIVVPVPVLGPDEALGYVLAAGLTYNTVFAARGVPVSVFDMHDRDCHVPGSGAVVLVAAVGPAVAREGRVRVGELRVVYPGVSNLLSPRAGLDPMHADFRIQGYETPDGTFVQFVRLQAPQLVAHSERLTLPEAGSYMLDLETAYKALWDVARLEPGERVFVEGAAGGTGTYAVACAALRGGRVTGLVSTETKGRGVLARGGLAYVNRKAPALAGVFTPVAADPSQWRAWERAGEPLARAVAAADGRPDVDVVVSSVGRDLFGRMVGLLAPGGRLVFYGATSGYTLAFLGKAGDAPPAEMLRRADLRPGQGVLVHRGVATGADQVGEAAVAAALERRARVVVAAATDADAEALARRYRLAGTVSLEALGRTPGFVWPETMPDYDTDPDGYRRYQDATLKPFGAAVGRLLAAPDNPRGHPDVIVERAGQDTLGVSAFLARPHTGVVVYPEGGEGRRFSFYAPNVWMHQKRVLFPGFAILGSHLSNAHQAEAVARLLDAGLLEVATPAVHAWTELAEANQALHENRHQGTLAVRVGAGSALDGARTAREVFAAWGSRFSGSPAVAVRWDPVRSSARQPRGPGATGRQLDDVAGLVALVTIDSPPANALGAAVLDELERAVAALEAESALGAVVVTGAGTMFVAGADIRQLRAFAGAADVERHALRAQGLFARLAALGAPVIAAVDGYALGGGNELQMACRWRVGAARAELGQPEINLHVLPGFGGTQMLPRLALRRARKAARPLAAALADALLVLLDGRRRPAEVACDLGLLDEVAPADALSHALGVARRVALGDDALPLWSPLGAGAPDTDALAALDAAEADPDVRRALDHHARVPRAAAARAILEAVREGLTRGLAAGLAREARLFGELVASEDGRAGMDRFLARRSLPLPLRREP